MVGCCQKYNGTKWLKVILISLLLAVEEFMSFFYLLDRVSQPGLLGGLPAFSLQLGMIPTIDKSQEWSPGEVTPAMLNHFSLRLDLIRELISLIAPLEL